MKTSVQPTRQYLLRKLCEAEEEAGSWELLLRSSKAGTDGLLSDPQVCDPPML